MDRSKNTPENTQSNDLQVVKNEALSAAPQFDKFKKEHEDSLVEPKTSKAKPFYKRPWFIVLIVFILILTTLFGYLGFVAYRTYAKIGAVESHGRSTVTAFQARDLQTAKAELDNTKNALNEANKSYQAVKPLMSFPILGAYLKDGDRVFIAGKLGVEVAELVIKAIEPYAELMGFTGAISSDPALTTAEDRIIFVAETVEKLAPEMDNISAKLKMVDETISEIDENRYPKTISGMAVRENITQAKAVVSGLADSLSNFQPIVKLLPDLLGNPNPRKYLLLFQNDAELRATGGFLTAYATLTITKGKIEPGISEDIYTLDNGFKKKVPAPDPIKKYLPLVYNWNLRDMNLSPDFKVSMDTFTTYMRESTVAPEYDAIIAIDTEVPVRILRVLGPIGVPGFGGQFSAENDPRCNCPQVIYELENIITKPTYEIREGRKSILGPLMNSMLANMMGSPKAKWAEFFNIFTESIEQKHLLMYFKDENKQMAAEALGAAGRITAYTEGDYLHINDSNFAGAKSNLFVESEVTQEITMGSDGSATKKLTLTYKNPRKGDNCNLEAGQLCLNGLLRSWTRVYVPKGSKLKSGRGFESDMETTEDLGYTVLEGFFTLAPQSVKKLEIEYTIPAGTLKDNDYRLLIQNQPGTDPVKHTITVNGAKPKVVTVDSDQEIIITR
ncbi:MAG: hypothetical protein Fur0011_5640 [Candidatus Microgenomates bacterium]